MMRVRIVIEGTPKFQVGDEDILFVHDNGKQFCPLVALLHGRYPVKQDGATGRRYVVRGDGTPLLNEQEVSRPLLGFGIVPSKTLAARSPANALDPAEFASRIKAAAAQHTKSTQP